MNELGRIVVPLDWFGAYSIDVGRSFAIQLEAEIVAADVEGVVLALSQPRVLLRELERWANPGSGTPCS